MRVETIGNATLYLGDCLTVLPTLAKVDVVITDPPYMNMEGGTALTFERGVAARRKDSVTVADPWAANLAWVPLAWDLADRAFFAFCSFHFLSELRLAVPGKPTALISWYQRNAAPSAANAPQFRNEFCWAFRKASGLDWRKLSTHIDIPRLQAGCMATERELNRDGSTAHPTQKPVSVVAELLKVAPISVLDPFMGSGTTGVACMRQGKPFVGIEIHEPYFLMACERIENAQRQERLFA